MNKKARQILSLILAGSLLLSGCGTEEGTSQAGGTNISDEGYIDTLTPKNDFYGYVNAHSLMETELDGKTVRGTLYDLNDVVNDQLNVIIDEIAASDKAFAPGSNEQLIHDLYHQAYEFFEDGSEMQAKDLALVDSIIEKIEAASTTDELVDVWSGMIFSYGIYPVIGCAVNENIYNIDENVLTIACYFPVDLESIKQSDIKAVSYRDSYVDRFKRFGVTGEEAKQRAMNMLYAFFEIAGHTDMAYLKGDKELEECYNLYSDDEVKELIGENWYSKLLECIGMKGKTMGKILVPDPEQVQSFLSLMDEEHLRVWKDCTIMSIMEQSDAFLPDKYNLSDPVEATSQRIARYYVKLYLEEELSEIYAERYFDESKREYISELCNEIRDEYYTLINNADWLTQEGRAILCRKLDTMRFYIGCGEPRTVDPADAQLIGETMLQTYYNFQKKAVAEILGGIDDRGEEDPFDDMSASTVNACYVAAGNYVIITAAILNEPVLDMNADRAHNLGYIGVIIGHEISHAFDSYGVKYNELGNYDPDVMPQEDIRAFRELQEKAIEYYNGFTVLSSHVKGKLTLGENLADISGVQCMLALAGSREEQKKFFESYAEYWKKLSLDTYAKGSLSTDVHAPSPVRVNAVVACFDEYYDIYDVTEGDPMYVAPEDRVRRW